MSGRPSRSYTHSLLSQRATSTHSHTGGAALSAAFHTSVDSRMAFEESLREDFRFRAVATVVLRLLPPNGHSPLKSCGKHWQVQNDWLQKWQKVCWPDGATSGSNHRWFEQQNDLHNFSKIPLIFIYLIFFSTLLMLHLSPLMCWHN